MKDILLIQDDRGVGQATVRILKVRGFAPPTWIAGVSSIEFTDNILQGLDINESPVQVDLAKYAIALVDGNLKIGVAHGWTLVPKLKKAGLLCIGMSTMFFAEMAAAEADYVIDPMDFPAFSEGDFRQIYERACAQRKSGS